MASGHLQVSMGYVSYFVFVMVATIPSFLACWFAPFPHGDDAPSTIPKQVNAGAAHEA
jgi:PAT family beta-lactamase induction signal transducer AmpG